MRAVVKRVTLSPQRRTLVISDIHGNLPFLKGLLAQVGFCREDVLILLGDMLERSEGSLATLRYVMELTKTHTVYPLMGNCDQLTPGFVDGFVSDSFYQRFFRVWGGECTLVQMARLAGVQVDSPAGYPLARQVIGRAFAPELEFLRALPQIYLDENYLFVHGGVPREDRLEELEAHGCMKNDDFLGQGLSFRRWVVVGHWPVTLYRGDIPSASPILLPDRHIASIDGGCTLKADGQLNALILPREPGGEFSYAAYDGFPVMTALDPQEASPDPVNIRWGRSALEVLEEGPEFCRCRHLETGRELDILTEYLRRDERGVHCEDSTDYRLPVAAGDSLSVVRQTSRGALCKKGGVTGWYFGRLN
ncbi:MAG: serine/threonine protein phosphatase [Oscillospiraceae bacterium]|nr:serine/threonine protein phosphatase [Oscillospiraceae bacterium]